MDEVMLRLKEGDENAFTELYEATSKAVFAFILSYCKSRAVAEDITQDTYIKVKRNIQSFVGGNPLPWLMQIAKYEYLNYYKKSKREVFTDFDTEDNGQFGSVEISEDTPILNLILTKLKPEESQIVVMYLIKGFKHREIAEIIGKPLGTVLWSYNQSMKKLKQMIEKEGLK
jgi:RNA polymerase sigma-70 factor (ECF subfamily)